MFGMALTGIGVPIALGLGTLGITTQLGMYGKVRVAYKRAVALQELEQHIEGATGMEIGDPYEGFYDPLEEQTAYNEKKAELMEQLKQYSNKSHVHPLKISASCKNWLYIVFPKYID